MITRLHHVAIFCSDISHSLDFYRDVFGLEVVRDSSYDRDWAEIFDWAPVKSIRGVHLVDPEDQASGCRLSLVGWQADAPADVPGGYVVLSFDCDVARVRERLLARGHDVSHITEKGGYFRGPDNLRIHISPKQFGVQYA